MNKHRLFFPRPFALLLLLLLSFGSGHPAENPEEPAPPDLEIDRTPPTNPQRVRPRKRINIIHNSRHERVEVGKDVVIGRNEVIRELVVIAGNATVDGTVEGNVVVVSGLVRINGQVGHDLVTILGSATLGPQADVGQDVVVVGGTLKRSRSSNVGGQQKVVAIGPHLPDFMWLQRWFANGFLLARPFPPQVKWVWLAAAFSLVGYLGVAVLFPRPVRACISALDQQPVASFFVGILLCVLLGPLLFLLVVSIAGILVIPFLFCALIVAVILGKLAVYAYTGQKFGRVARMGDVNLPTVLLLGAALFYLSYMVPVLGFAVWGVVTLVGLGAVLLAAFGSFRQEALAGAVAAPRMTLSGAEPPASAGLSTSTALIVAPPVAIPSDAALLPRVGFWRRFCATMLDFLLVGGLTIHLVGPLFLALWPAYFIAMWAWKGSTIGGIIMRIKVVRVDGQPVDFAVALVRSLSSFFSAFVLFLGFFWAGWDRERQAWHDKIAGTIVVKVPPGVPVI